MGLISGLIFCLFIFFFSSRDIIKIILSSFLIILVKHRIIRRMDIQKPKGKPGRVLEFEEGFMCWLCQSTCRENDSSQWLSNP